MSDTTSLVAQAEHLLQAATAALPSGGQDRPGQIDMARAVAEAIDSQRHLIAEAGTGTGKSLAYLAPVVASGKKTLIATATRALQDQLANKELPHLKSVSDTAFSFAVLKGRNNYVCRQRVNEHDRNQATLDGLGDKAEAEIAKLLVWSDTTETGDRAELDFEPSDAAWGAVSVTSRECPGRSKCPAGSTCLADQARDRAAAADVIVVNTHLLGINLFTDGAILPPVDVIVIDEAHQLEDVITATCGWSIGGGRFTALGRLVKAILDDPDTVDDLEDMSAKVADALDDLVGQRISPSEQLDLSDALNQARELVNEVTEMLRGLPSGKDPDADARRDRAMQASGVLLGDLTMTQQVDDSQVCWVEQAMRSPQLRVAPLDVGEVLAPKLWAETPTIMTSATIPAQLANNLGLDEGTFDSIDVTSPFDYQKQAILYCATKLPEPRSPNYEEEFLKELERLMVAAGGRTLGLFTSWRAMENAAEHLIGRLPGKVYTQRDLPKQALIDAFIDDQESSLLATIGFWQGIDVPGPAVTLVTIDRLPFPRPDDPLLSARREHVGPQAFRMVDLPRATTLLAQGAGRLIRTVSDEGVVAVLDSRLATKKSYRWDFISKLPDFARTSDTEVVLTRLRELREQYS